MSEGLQRATDSITVTIEFDGELIVLPITETMAARIETALKAGRSFYEVVEWDGVDTLVIHD